MASLQDPIPTPSGGDATFPRRPTSLFFRQFVIVFVVVVVTFALESWIVIHTSSGTIEALVQENLTARAQNVLEEVDRYVAERCADLRSWSTLSVMDEVYLQDRFMNIENYVLRLYREPPQPYLLIDVLNRDRKIVASSDLERINQLWPTDPVNLPLLAGTMEHLGEFPLAGGAKPRFFVVAQPILSQFDTDPIGWIVTRIRWQPVEELVRRAPIGGRPQESGRFLLLVDASGRALAGETGFLRDLPNEISRDGQIVPSLLGDLRLKREGSFVVATSGTAELSSSASRNLQIVALWRKHDAFAVLPIFLAVVLGSAGFGLALAAAGFIGFSRSITRRLGRLTEGTERLARGDLEVRVEEVREDEVGRLARSFNTMAGEMALARDSLESALARWKALVTTAPDLIYTVGHDGQILFVNRVLPGYDASRVVGTTVFDYVPESYHVALRSALEEVFKEGRTQSLDVEGPAADGSLAWYSTRLGPVERDGIVIAATLISTDITPRKRLEREIIEVSELERERIGRDLHDGIGQVLTGIGLLSKGLETRLERKNPEMSAEARQIKELVGQALEQTRSLSRGLVPIDVSLGGLRPALEEMAAGVEHVARVICTVHTDGDPGPTDQSRATHLFRIAQEAVSNSLRHGKASIISITLSQGADGGCLTIEDNGLGLNSDSTLQGGMGLRSMRFRAGVIGATFELGNRPGGGVIVTCLYP